MHSVRVFQLMGRGLCLLLCALFVPGCQVGRTWFHMDSNAPMPFFGFDLLPRKSAQLTPPDAEPGSSSPGRLDSNVRQVADRSLPRELRLPHVSLFGEDEESVTFSGPEPPFSR